LNLSGTKGKSSLECLGYRSSKTHQNPPQKILGEKKREENYDYSDSGIKATRAPQAILRGEPDLEKKKPETRDYNEMELSGLALGLRRRRRKRPVASLQGSAQAHVQERRSFRRKDDRSGKRHRLQSVGHSQTGQPAHYQGKQTQDRLK
jgi:hypothetical protein